MDQTQAGTQPDVALSQNGDHRVQEGGHVRDATFYDDVVVFLIERTTFWVSRLLLERGSEVFRAMLASPQREHVEGACHEGALDTYPIKLQGVTTDEFKDLLRVLYANLVETHKHLCGVRNIPSDWIAVLKLATLWEFHTIRKEAIHMLKGWDPIVRIVLARTYHIEGWTEDAIYSLTHRDEPLELQDFEAMGLRFAIGIIKLREIVLKHPNRMLNRPTEWLKCVGDVFGTEFVESLKREWSVSRD